MPRPASPATPHAALLHECALALADSDALAIGAVRDGVLLYVSPALARLFGLSIDDARRHFGDFVSPSDRQRVARALASPGEITIGFRAVRADGNLFEVQVSGSPMQLPDGAAMAIAVQETGRDRDTRLLSYAELFDGVTGLPNRRLFLDRLEQGLLEAGRLGRRVAVLAARIELVPQAGGRATPLPADLRKDAGTRLRAALRESDTLAAIDEQRFAALLPRIGPRALAATPAARAVAAFAAPLETPAGPQRVSCRIAVATFPEDAREPALLLEQALGGVDPAQAVAFVAAREAEASASPARVAWSPRFEVGIDVIDGQHRHLLELINRLSDELGRGRDPDALVDGLRELVRYTEHHFATEERLMDEVGATAQRHRSEHRRLLDTLTRVTLRLDAGGVSEGSRFLQDWLFKHIDEVDRPFAALLRTHGVK